MEEAERDLERPLDSSVQGETLFSLSWLVFTAATRAWRSACRLCLRVADRRLEGGVRELGPFGF